MMRNRLFFSLFAVLLLVSMSILYAQDNTHNNIRSMYMGKAFTEQQIMSPGDSCSVVNPERHDGFAHANGYTAFTDSVRMVLLFHPQAYPWNYTKVCIGWTALGGVASLSYQIVMYDSGSGGQPNNLLYKSPVQTATTIPAFPSMNWYSSVLTLPTVTSGAVYIGIVYDNNPATNCYLSMDEGAATPLWPGWYGVNATFPATWQTIQSVSGFGAYKCVAARTEGQLAIPPCPSRYSSQWCSAGTYANIPSATLYNACAWLGDTLYMQAPDGAGTATTTIMRYSLSANAWTTGVPLPVARVQGTLTACNGKLYYIGGGAAAGDAGSNTIYEYSAGAWTLKTPLPASINGHGTVCWGDSVLITISGPWGTPSTACYFFRPSSNTVGTTSPFGGPARRSHAVGIVGNKIFVACGFPFTQDLWIGTIGANATTITWAAGPVPPGVPRSRLGGVGICDKFYLIGGNNSVGATSSDTACVFNINGNTWTSIGGKPAPVHNNEAAVTYKLVGDTAKIFCPGGSSLAATTLNTDVIGCGPTVTGIHNPFEVPMAYTLNQNYPNPFNPSTMIKFGIPKSGNVKLVVFDVLGREVTTLVNEVRNAGIYEVRFDASSLASGVYFYRIEASGFTDVKKMLLIK